MQKSDLPELYKKEKDTAVKDRLMLYICVPCDRMGAAKAAHTLGRFPPWGSKRCRRHPEGDIRGYRPATGRVGHRWFQ